MHDADYIARGSDDRRRRAEAVSTPTPSRAKASWDAATAAAGAVLDAIDSRLATDRAGSFCAVRPPGHHALRDTAMGFCLFGNVALGAHYARRTHGAERVLIVDWDVHHGNGTQALVEHERDIHFVSMHQWPWYPGTGAAERSRSASQRLERPDARRTCRAAATSTRFAPAIDAATVGFVPDLVLISAGFDSLAGDPLGAFTLEYEHFEDAHARLVERAESWCGGRVVSALEGGYAPERLGVACMVHLEHLG